MPQHNHFTRLKDLSSEKELSLGWMPGEREAGGDERNTRKKVRIEELGPRNLTHGRTEAKRRGKAKKRLSFIYIFSF